MKRPLNYQYCFHDSFFAEILIVYILYQYSIFSFTYDGGFSCCFLFMLRIAYNLKSGFFFGWRSWQGLEMAFEVMVFSKI
ncbi:MAG: hypothetical protein EXX96DRAFT_567663 [Benjaminiella poitrasii]|nr:MAG: hypothetical protein EXX96DRAFT_567663 [Benjaminiella poitrasii]